MSIKDLFSQKSKSTKVVVAENAATASQYVEVTMSMDSKEFTMSTLTTEQKEKRLNLDCPHLILMIISLKIIILELTAMFSFRPKERRQLKSMDTVPQRPPNTF
jgi:hypothetical protein